MIIGTRLKELRKQKAMSQGDIEERTGLLRCYISRVENGHTVPSVETLEKLAGALEVPIYKIFHDGQTKAVAPSLHRQPAREWGTSGRDAETLRAFRKHLGKLSVKYQKLLIFMAAKLARP